MASLNKVQLIGHLGRDPESRFMPSGAAVCNFSIATTEKWTDKEGNKQEKTEWHNIVIFNKLAEIAQQYLKKGALVYLEGKLQTRKWQDKDGNDRYTTEIVCDHMQMLGGKQDGGWQQQEAPDHQQQRRPAAQQPAKKFDDFEDNIPF